MDSFSKIVSISFKERKQAAIPLKTEENDIQYLVNQFFTLFKQESNMLDVTFQRYHPDLEGPGELKDRDKLKAVVVQSQIFNTESSSSDSFSINVGLKHE